ncbi:hypothetical protein HK405_012192 [Cladochytrium tenue]|nr:hypothetical protein HK405_012192 [Cladochytrium tenue]
MLTELARAVEAEYPDLLGMALYSDIRPVYYARLGWQPMDTWTTTVRVPDHLATEAPASEGLAVVELSEADVHADGEARVKRLMTHEPTATRAWWSCRTPTRTSGTAREVCCTAPRMQATNRGPSPALLARRSSGHTETGEVGPVFALWADNYKDRTVDMLRLAADQPVDVAALFRAAATAVRAGLPVIRAWGQLGFAEAAIRRQLAGAESSTSVFEVATRTSSIPSLRLSSTTVEVAGPGASAVNWLAEKGHWC